MTMMKTTTKIINFKFHVALPSVVANLNCARIYDDHLACEYQKSHPCLGCLRVIGIFLVTLSYMLFCSFDFDRICLVEPTGQFDRHSVNEPKKVHSMWSGC